MTPTYQGEMQFRRYSDTSTQGQQVVFALADREALDAFIGKEGKRFMAVFVELGDDEQPVEPVVDRFKPGQMCREAIDLAANPAFHKFSKTTNQAQAAEHIRSVCSIGSRKDLDTDPVAAQVYVERVRVPFLRWMREGRSA